MKKTAIILLTIVLTLPCFASCKAIAKNTQKAEQTQQATNTQAEPAQPEEKTVYGTYVRKNDMEYAGNFSIYLAEDGHFSCVESSVSSHFLIGEYTYENGLVTMTMIGTAVRFEEGEMYEEQKTYVYRFRFTEDHLIYLADSSDNFSVRLPDQAEFERWNRA